MSNEYRTDALQLKPATHYTPKLARRAMPEAEANSTGLERVEAELPGVASAARSSHRAFTLTAVPLTACRPINRGRASGTRSLGRVSDRSRSPLVR